MSIVKFIRASASCPECHWVSVPLGLKHGAATHAAYSGTCRECVQPTSDKDSDHSNLYLKHRPIVHDEL